MMKMEERMKNSPKGTIFTNSDFYDISNPDAVKMPLHRLYSSNKIYRLISGYYTIPYYSNVLHEYGYPSANAMAEKLAEKYAWNICPSGVVSFKKKFYPCNWARYDLVLQGGYKLVPKENAIAYFGKDYKAMSNMIYGESIPCETMMKRIQQFEEQLNKTVLDQIKIQG